jgi:hypothetical protein
MCETKRFGADYTDFQALDANNPGPIFIPDVCNGLTVNFYTFARLFYA